MTRQTAYERWRTAPKGQKARRWREYVWATAADLGPREPELPLGDDYDWEADALGSYHDAISEGEQ